MSTRNLDPDAGWVRVEDAMPEDDVEVIVYTIGLHQWLAESHDGVWHDDQGWGMVLPSRRVTHWRHLPAPPKEGE